MTRLSLCLIARDEEAELPACLESVRGAVDEVVLVDTGSTDRTCEVARAAGAVVLTRPWDDDFAAPRNLAARHATGDFILVLDADERLAPGAGAALRSLLRRPEFDLGLVRLHNAASRGAAPAEVLSGQARVGQPVVLPRVLRRTPDLEWRGAIHENVADWLLRGQRTRLVLPVDVLHYGYLPDVLQARNKRERNRTLLRRSIEREPGDVTAYGYLALELVQDGLFEEARAVVERAWPLVPSQPAWRCLARPAVARGILALRRADAEGALEAAQVGEARSGPHPDWDFLRGHGAGDPGRADRRGRAAGPPCSRRRRRPTRARRAASTRRGPTSSWRWPRRCGRGSTSAASATSSAAGRRRCGPAREAMQARPAERRGADRGGRGARRARRGGQGPRGARAGAGGAAGRLARGGERRRAARGAGRRQALPGQGHRRSRRALPAAPPAVPPGGPRGGPGGAPENRAGRP